MEKVFAGVHKESKLLILEDIKDLLATITRMESTTANLPNTQISMVSDRSSTGEQLTVKEKRLKTSQIAPETLGSKILILIILQIYHSRLPSTCLMNQADALCALKVFQTIQHHDEKMSLEFKHILIYDLIKPLII